MVQHENSLVSQIVLKPSGIYQTLYQIAVTYYHYEQHYLGVSEKITTTRVKSSRSEN